MYSLFFTSSAASITEVVILYADFSNDEKN